jgi:hypothetical protein
VVASLLDGLPPEDAARALAQLVNRAAARLHTLSRAEAAARKDQPSWPQWAQLQNAARALVLHASTARELAARLPAPPDAANSPPPPPEAPPPEHDA